MEDLEKSIYYNHLFDIYGSLLSNTQQKMFHLYYELNLSLSEIASQVGVSRNAVYDALKKGEESLNNYEQKLQIYKKNNEIYQVLKEELSNEIFEKIMKRLEEENYGI